MSVTVLNAIKILYQLVFSPGISHSSAVLALSFMIVHTCPEYHLLVPEIRIHVVIEGVVQWLTLYDM